MIPSNRPSHSKLIHAALVASVIALCGWAWFLLAYRHHPSMGAANMFPDGRPFEDFTIYWLTFSVFHQSAFFDFNVARSHFAYPPAIALLYAFFYSIPKKVTVYLAVTLSLWMLVTGWAWSELRLARMNWYSRTVLLLCLSLSYPAVFLLERGNFELFVWAAVAGGILCYTRKLTTAAAILFGLATALKLYPVLLLGVFLWRRKWWQPVLIGIATFALATFAAIAFTGPTIAIAARGYLGGVLGFQKHYALTVRTSELRFDHSLFSVVKVFASPASLAHLTPLYYAVGGVVFGALYLVRIRQQGWINQVFFLSVCMILLPPVSYEYTLVHIYVPAMLLVSIASRSNHTLSFAGMLAFFCVLLLMLPLDVLHGAGVFLPGQIQSIILCVAAVSFGWPLIEEPSPYSDTAFAARHQQNGSAVPIKWLLKIAKERAVGDVITSGLRRQ